MRAIKFGPRAGFLRKTRNGKIYVAPTVCTYQAREKDRSDKASYCGKCGAIVQMRKTSGGGLIPYEGGMAHLGTLHSCFTVGRGLSRRLAADTDDLFDYAKSIETK